MKQPSISKLKDEQIVELVIAGDQDAYGEIISRYQEKLIRYVNRYCHDEAQSQDVVQMTFIKAYTNLNGFDTKLKFSSWIYRISHNEAINIIKKYRHEFTPSDESWFQQLPGDDKPISTTIDNKLLGSLLAKQIAQLDSKYQDPLVLHYFEGQSYQEISDVLRLPVATVGTRIKRAKQQIKKLLVNKGISYEW